MDCGVNGPAGQNAVRHVSTMWMMLDSDAVSTAAIAHLQLLTMQPLPALETMRSKNLVTLFSVQVMQAYTFTPQLGWNKGKKNDILYLLSVNGGWSAWSQWSKCSAKCDSGVQIRERFCNSPSPLHGGSKCQGPHIQTRDCNSHPCSGTAATATTVNNNYKYSNNINSCLFKSMCLHPQVHVHREWCTWRQLNVRHRVVRVRGCVWTWLSLRCSAPPPAMMAAIAPQASTCSTEVVCTWLSVHATTRARCMMLIQPCLAMPAITGIVSSYG